MISTRRTRKMPNIAMRLCDSLDRLISSVMCGTTPSCIESLFILPNTCSVFLLISIIIVLKIMIKVIFSCLIGVFAVAKEALWKKVPEKVLHRPPQKGGQDF